MSIIGKNFAPRGHFCHIIFALLQPKCDSSNKTDAKFGIYSKNATIKKNELNSDHCNSIILWAIYLQIMDPASQAYAEDCLGWNAGEASCRNNFSHAIQVSELN